MEALCEVRLLGEPGQAGVPEVVVAEIGHGHSSYHLPQPEICVLTKKCVAKFMDKAQFIYSSFSENTIHEVENTIVLTKHQVENVNSIFFK